MVEFFIIIVAIITGLIGIASLIMGAISLFAYASEQGFIGLAAIYSMLGVFSTCSGCDFTGGRTYRVIYSSQRKNAIKHQKLFFNSLTN